MVKGDPFNRDCDKCGLPIRMERGRDLKWRAYAQGTNEYHDCPNWHMRDNAGTEYPEHPEFRPKPLLANPTQ